MGLRGPKNLGRGKTVENRQARSFELTELTPPANLSEAERVAFERLAKQLLAAKLSGPADGAIVVVAARLQAEMDADPLGFPPAKLQALLRCFGMLGIGHAQRGNAQPKTAQSAEDKALFDAGLSETQAAEVKARRAKLAAVKP